MVNASWVVTVTSTTPSCGCPAVTDADFKKSNARRLRSLSTKRAGSNASRGELFSYLFFAREFAGELLARGEADARRWLSRTHDEGPWRLRR